MNLPEVKVVDLLSLFRSNRAPGRAAGDAARGRTMQRPIELGLPH